MSPVTKSYLVKSYIVTKSKPGRATIQTGNNMDLKGSHRFYVDKINKTSIKGKESRILKNVDKMPDNKLRVAMIFILQLNYKYTT